MRILQVRFKNLNSLQGIWDIDFTAPEYLNYGIFAITGATGAGKTTILDAICLALYGSTPRLGKISATSNEIMSRGTAECFAEVVFSNNKGTFRSHWSQKRSKGQAGGKLQTPKHEVAQADGKILETYLSKTLQVVEEITGLSFEQFTKSTMLAQGNFSAFLHATPAERSPLLEQITGTQIYSDISIAVQQRCSKETQKLTDLQLQQNMLTAVAEDDIYATQLQIDKTKSQTNTEKQQAQKLTLQLQWLQDWQTNILKATQLRASKEEHAKAMQTFTLKSQTIAKAEAALRLEADWTFLSYLREQILHAQQQLELNTQTRNSAQQKEGSLAKNLQEQEKLTEQAKAQEEILQQDYLLFKAWHEKVLQTSQRQEELQKQEKNIFKDLEKALVLVERTGSEVENYQLQTEKLVVFIAQSRQNLANLLQKTMLLELHKIGILQSRLIPMCEKELEELVAKKLQSEEQFSQAQKFVSFTEARKELKDQLPCPLCGSLEHPYRLAESFLNLDTNLSTLKQEISNLAKRIDELKSQKSAYQVDLQVCITSKQQKWEQLNSLENLYHVTPQNNVLPEQELQSIYETKNLMHNATKLDETIANLQAEISQRQLIELPALQAKIHQAQLLLAECQYKKQTLTLQLEETQRELASQKKERKQFEQSIAEKFQQRDVLQEWTAQKHTLQNHQQHRELILTEQTKAKTEWDLLNTEIKKNRNELALLNEKYANAQMTFLKGLSREGFANEQEYCEAKISTEELQDLLNKQSELNNQLNILSAQESLLQNAKQELLEQGKHLQIIGESQAETCEILQNETDLKQKLDDCESLLSHLDQLIGRLEEQLKQQSEIRDKFNELQQKILVQQQNAKKWEQLSRLIGSADGKKFRNFAQALTFENLVFFANQVLTKITDRYELIQNTELPLALAVIDRYHADEMRSTKNLSGGEGFLISLALALGFSKLSSKNVSMESLFLDEGFGTLDDEALEMALECLAGIQREGKLIGIISHVGALKERIPLQLSLEPSMPGKSKLKGHGVTYLGL